MTKLFSYAWIVEEEFTETEHISALEKLGLVGVWTSDCEVELRHLAVSADAQDQGAGRQLVAALFQVVLPKGCRRIHTIARNTSAGFFPQLGFRTITGNAPRHPIFENHGITFELMENVFEPITAQDAKQPASVSF